jgi:hypothetical protein
MQHRLRYALRGGELAFAIPEGDLDAVAELADSCCDFWNGANSVLVAVAEDGTIAPTERLFEVREPEQIYLHARLGAGARAALVARFGQERLTDIHTRTFSHELHPLNLQPAYRDPPADGPQTPLPEPVYDDADLARLARIIWGRIDDEDRPEYESAFLVERSEGDAAHSALLRGQTHALSPLAQSTYLMRIHSQSGPLRARQLFVLDPTAFADIVFFWNVRARATNMLDDIPVIAVPTPALASPEYMQALVDWVEHGALKPDILVHARPADRDAAVAAIDQLGFREAAGDARLSEFFGEPPDERRALEYVFVDAGYIGHRLRRGLFAENVIRLEPGRNVVRFEPPPGFGTRNWGGYVRLDLLSWPLPFPPTAATARRVHQDAFVDQGVVCLTTSAANNALTFDLVVPGADDVLSDFLAAHGRSARLSAAGRYAQALIGRLGGPQRLDGLARPRALAILEPLTPPSRLKLVQRLDRMLTDRYGAAAPPADELAEMIRTHVADLELQSRSLNDIASLTGAARGDLLDALEELVDVGFIRRGRQERCPECGFEDFYALAEVAERVLCHACQTQFLLGVRVGDDEPRLAYQLDPLMARAMDQNLLPVLLTLRHLYSAAVATSGAFWPGLEVINADGSMQDCDILLAQEGNKIVCECKQNAAGLSLAQAEQTVALADFFDATTYFAALEGDFAAAITTLAQERGRIVLLTREQLLPER